MTIGRGLKSLAAKTAAFVGIASLAFSRVFAADSAPDSNSLDPAAVAREVYQDPAYWWKRADPSRAPKSSWLDPIFEWIYKTLKQIIIKVLDWILSLLSLFSGLSTRNWSIGATLIRIVIVVLALVLIWRIAIWIARRLKRRGVEATEKSENPWEEFAHPTDLFAKARGELDAGRYAETIRLALLALIARFEKEGLLRHDATRTNREYQTELSGKTEFAASFGELARIHERVWYGRVRADRGDAERAIHVCEYIMNNKEHASD